MINYFAVAFLGVITLAVLISAIVITPEKHFSFITLFGKYQKTLSAGLGFKIPFLTSINAREFLGLQQQNVDLTLKTKDQVTFNIVLKIQYFISDKPEQAFKAVYNIDDYRETMKAVAIDASISVTNNIELEDVYNSKEKIAEEAENKLRAFFADDYGINIKTVLSDEPKLPQEVEDQANSVIAAKRQMESAKYDREAIYTRKVGEAEADGESVKIRMEKLGEARQKYATSASEAIKCLVEAGVSANAAAAFLNRIGDNDAIVTASRNESNTIIISQNSENSSDVTSQVAALQEALKNK